MGGHNNVTTGEDMRWPEKNEDAFLANLYERVKRHPNGTPSFKQVDWNEIDEELFSAIGQKYGAERLQGKYNRLRLKHRQFSDLISHTGVTYSSSSNQVYATEEVWKMFKKKHKNYITFKSKGCRNYEMLGQIFNNSSTHHASTQLPLNSDGNHQNEEQFFSQGVHVIEGEKSCAGSSRGKRPIDDYLAGCNCVNKETKLENFDFCLEILASSLSARAERDLAKAKKYKEMPEQATRAPYSIDECMDELENLDDVSDTSYIKALEKFKDPDWRIMFVKMSLVRKKSWLKSLE
ncbi:hypothetical protein POPTR_017G120900v4 [Populus trichocarpa]|uniref:Myb/SANT-like domain-containing protein n=2 Tax=Populus trichocarpa TaxID=3694 RepID=A0A2K1X6V5_POPTR|nr:uncharacterized protein LOC18099432 [Populus trichocarpa]PNS96515.1 hypothetical protein POPTR_017G120900v4 [Populus trichocarpa]|eukprot:XP_006383378.2 uncharacterized protein LOC18099432 [Populus trichocarpa]